MEPGDVLWITFLSVLLSKLIRQNEATHAILNTPITHAFQKGVLFALAAQVDSTSQFGHIHSISFDPEQHFVHMVCEGKRSAAWSSPRRPHGPPWHIKAPQHWSFSRSEGYVWSIFVQIHQSWQTGPERNFTIIVCSIAKTAKLPDLTAWVLGCHTPLSFMLCNTWITLAWIGWVLSVAAWAKVENR